MDGRAVVALLDWRRGGALPENRRLLERAAAGGRVGPRGWRSGRWRTLTVRADGTLEFGRFSVGTAARRADPAAEPRTGRIGKRD